MPSRGDELTRYHGSCGGDYPVNGAANILKFDYAPYDVTETSSDSDLESCYLFHIADRATSFGASYPFHDRDILVTACGRICMHRKRVNITGVLAGQALGIKEVDDGIWLVSFMHYDLGYFDLEQRTLQPLDSPFGPGLSPMS